MNRATSTACLKRFRNCSLLHSHPMISPICTRRHSLTDSSPHDARCPMPQTFHDSLPTPRSPSQTHSYADFFTSLRRQNWIITSSGFWTISSNSCETSPRKCSEQPLMHKLTLRIRSSTFTRHFSQNTMPNGASTVVSTIRHRKSSPTSFAL